MAYSMRAQSQTTFVQQRPVPGARRMAEHSQLALSGGHSLQPRPSEGERPASVASVRQTRDLRGEMTRFPGGESDLAIPLSAAGLQARRIDRSRNRV